MEEFKKEYDLLKSENENPYYFEGIASSYGNADSYGDIFLEGSLDDCVGKTVPIMVNHVWDITKAIGYGKLEKDGSEILIKGEFIKDDPVSEKIVSLKKSGVPLKLSIGGRIFESKPLRKKDKMFRGIVKADVFETSVVFLGANPKAQITKSSDENYVRRWDDVAERLLKIYRTRNKFNKNYSK